MHLNLELPNDLETQLRREAHQKGATLNQYIISLIQEKVGLAKSKAPSLSKEETALFQIINKGFSEDFWKRFRQLNKKRQAEIMRETERRKLISMNDKLEAENVERIKALIQLSKIRNTDLKSLMVELSLKYRT
jgi:hemerythrin-like domain-containing protein